MIKVNNDLSKDKFRKIWYGIRKRCNNKNLDYTHKCYLDCILCEEWEDFNNFYIWCQENYYEIDGEKMEIDKDILFKNNKIYSPKKMYFCSAYYQCDIHKQKVKK